MLPGICKTARPLSDWASPLGTWAGVKENGSLRGYAS